MCKKIKEILWFLSTCMVFIFSMVSLFLVSDKVEAALNKRVINQAFETVVKLEITKDGRTAKCSGTVVGVSTILTATHCVEGHTSLKVNEVDVVVVKFLHDGKDNTLLLIDATFPGRAARINPGAVSESDRVFIIGMPYMLDFMYREGYVMGTLIEPSGDGYFVLDMNTFFGDSGSAVFSESGAIIGVMSAIGGAETPEGIHGKLDFKYALSPFLNFTSQQYKDMGVKYEVVTKSVQAE